MLATLDSDPRERRRNQNVRNLKVVDNKTNIITSTLYLPAIFQTQDKVMMSKGFN